jgi:hypothetical protein
MATSDISPTTPTIDPIDQPQDSDSPTDAMLKADFDSGATGDKTEVFDPRMVVLGTCEEAAGASPDTSTARMGPASRNHPPLEERRPNRNCPQQTGWFPNLLCQLHCSCGCRPREGGLHGSQAIFRALRMPTDTAPGQTQSRRRWILRLDTTNWKPAASTA